MRNITIEKTVYKFEELTEEGKQKARQEYLDLNRPYYLFSEDVQEIVKTEYNMELEPNYSLSYSQGDGFAFRGEVYIKDLLENENIRKLLENEFSEKEIKRIEFIVENCLSETITLHINGHYTHKYSIHFEEDIRVIYHRGENILIDTYDSFIAWFKEFIYDLCDKFENEGYKYFYEVDDTEIVEYSNDEDIEYFENGVMYQE